MSKTRETKEQLVNELAEARRRIAELEASEAERKQVTWAEWLAVVSRIAKVAGATLDLDALMERVYQEVVPAFQADAFFIALYDEEAGELDFRFAVDEGVRQPPERLPLGVGWTSLVVTERKPLVIRDSEQERDHLPEGVPSGTGKIPASWLGAPLVVGEQVMGVISVQAYRPHAWDEEHEQLLFAIADQVAVVLENARLFEDTKSRLAQLTALQETTKAVASILELDKLLNLIVQQAATLFQGTGGIINLVDWEKKEDEVIVASGSVASALGFRSPLEGSLGGWVALHNQPVISNQLQNDERVDPRMRSGEVRVQSAAIAPLIIKDQVIGTLVVQDKQGGKGEFDQADLDLLVAFANQAATAIENARLYEKVQQELTERKQAEEALQKAYEEVEKQVGERTAELQRETAERERLQQEVIEAQKRALRELSTPIIPVMERIIVMPLIGSIDTLRAKDITRSLLAGIRDHRAKVVILDITGVPIVDTGVANHLNKTIQAARLKGAQTIVTGIADAVAEAIVDLGIDWSGIETLADLQTGLRVALSSLGIRLTK